MKPAAPCHPVDLHPGRCRRLFPRRRPGGGRSDRHPVRPAGGYRSPAVNHLDHRPGGHDHDQAPVAAPAKAKRLKAFQTPSGNIACMTWNWPEDDGSVRCDISQYRYAPPPKPDYCDTDWGGAFSIEPDGAVDVLCAGDTVYSLDHPKPAAGTSVRIGSSVCEVQTRLDQVRGRRHRRRPVPIPGAVLHLVRRVGGAAQKYSGSLPGFSVSSVTKP